MNTIDLLNNHRSVRRYQSRPVPQDVLNRILECGSRASNTGNMQIYSIIVTDQPDDIAALSKLHYGQGATAPLFLTVCVDVNRYHHWCRLRGCDEPYDNYLWLMSGTVDASLAAQNICVAAEAEGLGFCYLGTVMYNTRAIAELLDLPKGVVPVVTLSMGYPDEQPAQSERLPLEGIVHHGRYHHYTDDDINEIHRIREEFPFNQEMVRVNKTENLAQIFTQIRYPKKDNVAISQALLEFVEQAGMMNNE
ncbi:MAG: nitroreductase family protein [Bacteroidales bacterium]|nr:nitroreductase family protein [Bacteroidales bacterium]